MGSDFYEVKVTEADVAAAENSRVTRYVEKCPIAQAVRRATGVDMVSVVSSYGIRAGEDFYFTEDDRVDETISWYDNTGRNRPKLPFTFTLKLWVVEVSFVEVS